LGLETLGVHPYYLDVESFCRQALAKELPPLIGAFNLNAGITPIHHWCVVPAVAAWCDIEPFPVHADVLIAGERKDLASLIAQSVGLRCPADYDSARLAALRPEHDVVLKPRDLGGSVGVERLPASEALARLGQDRTLIVQDFVPGFDVTVPVVFQPTSGSHRAPACVLYMPDGPDRLNWIHDRTTKISSEGYRKLVVELPAAVETRISNFAATAQLGAYSRVDLRIAATTPEYENPTFWDAEIAFLEVNPLPTLRHGINFLNVVASDPFQRAFAAEVETLRAVLDVVDRDISMELVLAITMCMSGEHQSHV
jgi:hypothetical protein